MSDGVSGGEAQQMYCMAFGASLKWSLEELQGLHVAGCVQLIGQIRQSSDLFVVFLKLFPSSFYDA